MTKNELKRIIIESISEATKERDPYVSNDGYALGNSKDLETFLFDPQRKINNNAFVNISYITEVTLNKTFNNGGYTDKQGNTLSSDEIKANGRNLNQGYINDFLSNNDFSKKRGPARPFVLFTILDQTLNWGSMNYGKRKTDIDNLFATASEDDLNDFANRDEDFQKKLKKYISLHPEEEDELQSLQTIGFPRETIRKIMQTNLVNSGTGWTHVDGNDDMYQHAETGNKALRFTKSNNLKAKYRYFIYQGNKLERITTEEYTWIKSAFGGKTRKLNNIDPSAIRQAITDISNRYSFKNYLIPSIAKLSFTANGKPVTYTNNQLPITNGMTVDASQLLSLGEHESITLNPLQESYEFLSKIITESIIKKLSNRY